MKLYRYIVLDKQGQEQQGSIEAEDRQSAGKKLRNQGLYVLGVNDADAEQNFSLNSPLETKKIANAFKNYLPVTVSNKIFFFRQIALMLRSGLSLTEAMKTVRDLASGKLKTTINTLLDDIQSGDSLSIAIARHDSFFPEMAEYMIRSAEASGQLDEVMDRIADHMELKAKLKRDVLTTLFYPMVTLLIAVGMFYFLVTGVIPKFAKFFENNNKPIPPQTQSLLDISAFFTQWGLYIVVGIGVVIAVIIYTYHRPGGRLLIDRFLLKVPVIGSIIMLGAMSQAAWSLSMLLRSGLPLVDSLNIVKQITTNRIISMAFQQAAEGVLRGRDLGNSLNSPYITPMVRQLASVGERSGSLDQIMQEAGRFYHQMLEAKNKFLGSMIEPVAILIIGGMVAYVYIAFFKAIFAVSGG